MQPWLMDEAVRGSSEYAAEGHELPDVAADARGHANDCEPGTWRGIVGNGHHPCNSINSLHSRHS
jgi:hypothetical protein